MSRDAVFDRIEEMRGWDRPSAPSETQRVIDVLPDLLDIVEAAHELVGVTTHVNVTGAEYAERKMLYTKLRGRLSALLL